MNVSHRAAHGWVYAATVKHGEQASDPPSEGRVRIHIPRCFCESKVGGKVLGKNPTLSVEALMLCDFFQTPEGKDAFSKNFFVFFRGRTMAHY